MAKPQQSIPNKVLVTEDGTELLMSYGMFQDIMRLIGANEDAVDLLINDAEVRNYVICRLFTDLKRPIETLEELINPYDIPLSPLELDSVIAWVSDHVLHFTVSTSVKTRPVLEKYQSQAASLNQLKIGSQD